MFDFEGRFLLVGWILFVGTVNFDDNLLILNMNEHDVLSFSTYVMLLLKKSHFGKVVGRVCNS